MIKYNYRRYPRYPSQQYCSTFIQSIKSRSWISGCHTICRNHKKCSVSRFVFHCWLVTKMNHFSIELWHAIKNGLSTTIVRDHRSFGQKFISEAVPKAKHAPKKIIVPFGGLPRALSIITPRNLVQTLLQTYIAKN